MASPSASPEAEPQAEGELDAADSHAWHCTMAALRQDEANCDVVFVVGYGPWRSPLIIVRDGTPAGQQLATMDTGTWQAVWHTYTLPCTTM